MGYYYCYCAGSVWGCPNESPTLTFSGISNFWICGGSVFCLLLLIAVVPGLIEGFDDYIFWLFKAELSSLSEGSIFSSKGIFS